MSILVSGSLVYDHIMDFPDRFKNHIQIGSLHVLNVCFMVNKLGKSKGGTGGNIAYNMKMLGAEPILISSVGQDGGEYLSYFKEQGIKTDYIKKDENKLTASCYITTDLDDNQITAFYNGALNRAPSVNSIKKKFELAIIAPTEKKVMQRHLDECAKKDIKIMFDIGQQITAFSNKELKDAIGKAYFLIGNDHEVKVLQERLGWDLKEIFKRVKILITTLGKEGSLIQTADGEEIRVEACRIKKIVDPTGAGDAYRAGLLLGLDKGYNLRGCCRLGSVAASFAIEKYGTQEHRFSLADFVRRYKTSYREDVKL